MTHTFLYSVVFRDRSIHPMALRARDIDGREHHVMVHSREWFRKHIALERGESITAGSLGLSTHHIETIPEEAREGMTCSVRVLRDGQEETCSRVSQILLWWIHRHRGVLKTAKRTRCRSHTHSPSRPFGHTTLTGGDQ